MPGAAACAVAVSNNARTSKRSSRDMQIVFFIFVALIAALLVDMDFCHEPTEVLRVIGEVVKIGGVEIEHLARGIPRGIQNHVERLAASQRDRVGGVIEVVSRL